MKNICSICEYENRIENIYCTQCGSKVSADNNLSAKLLHLNDEKQSSIFGLNGNEINIGRHSSNQFVVNDDQVSKNHAKIFSESNCYWIEDLKSKNGTFINGKKITKREKLLNGSLIKLGSTFLRFEENRH